MVEAVILGALPAPPMTPEQVAAAFEVAEAEHALWAHADRIAAVQKAMDDATDNLAYRAHREELLRLQNGDVRMLMWRRAQDARRRWAEVRP